MGNKRSPFEPGTVYHVYNHGNAEDNLFRDEENYVYFLKRYVHYIHPVARTYAFCLMPNHFHLMVRIRGEEALEAFYKVKNRGKDPQSLQDFADLVSNQFKNFLISYAKAFNKRYNRRGSLFLDNINRKPVKEDAYYTQLICYIHQNPVKHGFADHPSQWPFSSYQIMLSQKTTHLEGNEVLSWFGGEKAYLECHRQIQEINREEFY